MKSLNKICGNILLKEVNKCSKWTIILKYDYPDMSWGEAVKLSNIVSKLHSFEDTNFHYYSRGLK